MNTDQNQSSSRLWVPKNTQLKNWNPLADEVYLSIMKTARGGAVGRHTALQTGTSRVRFPMVSLEFFTDIIVSVALWPWGRLSL
jgi:hypothetical protein